MRILLWIGLAAGATWLGFRLWPAIRSEPSTWLGEDWRKRLPL